MDIPLWPKLIGVGYLVVLVPVYWRVYGPRNFLWLSDIGLFLTVGAIALESRLLASMAAMAILVLESAWIVDFLAGGRAGGLADYMFDRKLPLALRGLSLFHLAVPPVLIWIVWQAGYDGRAVFYQLPLTWAVLLLSFRFSTRAENVNWVHGVGYAPERRLPPLAYLALEAAIITAIQLATHAVLLWLFAD